MRFYLEHEQNSIIFKRKTPSKHTWRSTIQFDSISQPKQLHAMSPVSTDQILPFSHQTASYCLFSSRYARFERTS